MELYLKKTNQVMEKFEAVDIEQISRTNFFLIDILAKMAATSDATIPKSVSVEVKPTLNIEQKIDVMRIEKYSSLMEAIISNI